jgi:hypothetical protein
VGMNLLDGILIKGKINGKRGSLVLLSGGNEHAITLLRVNNHLIL